MTSKTKLDDSIPTKQNISIPFSPLLFALAIVLLVVVSIYTKAALDPILEEAGLSSFRAKHTARAFVNFSIFFGAVWMIKKLSLTQLAGVGDYPFVRKYLLLAPLLLILMSASNLFELDYATVNFFDLGLLFVSSLSIGLFEEFVMLGLLQSYFLKCYWLKKNGIWLSVIFTCLMFGLLHFVTFSEGLVEEVIQVTIAAVLGLMFGTLLLRTNRLLPIAIIHGLFDFFSLLDEFKPPVAEVLTAVKADRTLIDNLLSVAILVAPMLIFSLIQLRKVSPQDVGEKAVTIH